MRLALIITALVSLVPVASAHDTPVPSTTTPTVKVCKVFEAYIDEPFRLSAGWEIVSTNVLTKDFTTLVLVTACTK